MARLLYFAWVRERMGKPTESLAIPSQVTTVAQLLDHLRQQGEPYASALADHHLRVAVNQVYARPEDPVTDSAEIAIFPPVSGGDHP